MPEIPPSQAPTNAAVVGDDAEPVVEVESGKARFNPWLFVPLLYFMQAIPVTIVQEMSVVFYKDLGIANESITRWTSLISLPWSLQLLLGPLVDLNGTKRRWILGGQALIALGLIATAFLLRVPNFFQITLLILAATAITSALCNIATDGFYILSQSRDQQAKFVGVQSSCYKLGRLFCMGLLVWIVGMMMSFPSVHVQAPQYASIFAEGNQYLQSADLTFKDGQLATKDGLKIEPKMEAPLGAYGVRVTPEGEVFAKGALGEQRLGRLDVRWSVSNETGRPPLQVGPAAEGMSPALAWPIILGCAALFYILGHFVNRVTVPRPPEDRPAAELQPGETERNIFRAVDLVTIGVFGYFFLNSIVRLTAHTLTSVFPGMTGWKLPDQQKIIGFDLGLGGVGTELFQLVLCGVLLAIAVVSALKLLRGSTMADALVSYIRQDGFPAILFFILFYRFGEAMVGKMTPLFLKDPLDKGGLAIPNEVFGPIKGFAGVVGIILGGIVGGWMVSKLGLRKAFLPLAICMHAPNLLYLWASYQHPGIPALYGIEFVDQFGYGFGFAAYTVYLMWVAQRGNYKTSHYAVGAGMGALCIATAGVVSGIIQKNFGYHGFFISVIFLSLPGLISLLFIPLEEKGPVLSA